MISQYLGSIAILLALLPGQAHCMWKLKNTTTQQAPKDPIVLMAEDYLNHKNLSGFLAYVKEHNINPNHIVTELGDSALTLACAQDKTGQIIKSLLEQGGIVMDRSFQSDGIWEPLYVAKQAENWAALDLLLAHPTLQLTDAEIAFACSGDWIRK